jgi:hypothetical protein
MSQKHWGKCGKQDATTIGQPGPGSEPIPVVRPIYGLVLSRAPVRNPPMGSQPQAAPGGINFAAFGTSLSSGLSTGLAAAILAAQQLAHQLLQAASTKTDWTQIQKEQILKIMGHPENADFASLATSVWQEFISEGKTANAVERVLKSKFRIDADDPDALDVTPYFLPVNFTGHPGGSICPSGPHHHKYHPWDHATGLRPTFGGQTT